MVIVYSAANSLEAHMIKGLLEQYEILAYIQGEHLQSGIGELPAVSGLVKVSVDNINQGEAKKIIQEWESNSAFNNVVDTKSAMPGKIVKSELPIFSVVTSFILGAVCMYFYSQSPVTNDGIDFNGDKINDIKWTYKNHLPSKTEWDRNLDGDVDSVTSYKNGLTRLTKEDNDFNGTFDTEYHYTNESIYRQEIDTNDNGEFDLFIDHEINYNNYIATLFNEKTRLIKKVQQYKMGKLSSAELDTNDDGEMDVFIMYDFFEEEVNRTPIN